jgi:hypothetical protein
VSNVPLIDLAIQRQAAARATMMWQMLNPDLTVGDLDDKSSFKAAKINDYRNWEAFANREMHNQVIIQGKRFVSPSIESWHDGIHVLMGTGSWYDGGMPVFQGEGVDEENQSPKKGHMGDPNVAAVRLPSLVIIYTDSIVVRSYILPASLVRHFIISLYH